MTKQPEHVRTWVALQKQVHTPWVMREDLDTDFDQERERLLDTLSSSEVDIF